MTAHTGRHFLQIPGPTNTPLPGEVGHSHLAHVWGSRAGVSLSLVQLSDTTPVTLTFATPDGPLASIDAEELPNLRAALADIDQLLS